MGTSLQITDSNQRTAKLILTSPFLKRNDTNYVLQFLDFKDLMAFEMATSKHRDITHQAWSILRVKDYATATFSDVEKDKYREKFNYVLATIASTNLYTVYPTIEEARKLEKKFSFFIKKTNRFKRFGGYLEKVIRLKKNIPPPDSRILTHRLKCLAETALHGCDNGIWSGDILLQGQLLIHDNKGWSEQTFLYYLHAIRNGACCIIRDKDFSLNHLRLAMESARKKDFRSLEAYLTHQRLTLTHLEEMQKFLGSQPPILWKIFQIKSKGMSNKEKADKFENLLDEIYEGYGNRISKEIVLTVAEIKDTLNKLNEADKLYEKLTSSVSYVVPDVIPKKSLILTIYNIFSKIKFLCRR